MRLSFLGFLFASYIPELLWKKPGVRKYQWHKQNKALTTEKPAVSQSKDRKGANSEDRKLLDNNHSTSTKHHRKNRGLSPIHSTVDSLDLHPCEAMSGVEKKSPTGVFQKRPTRKPKFSSPPGSNGAPSVETMRRTGTPPTNQQEPPTSDVNRLRQGTWASFSTMQQSDRTSPPALPEACQGKSVKTGGLNGIQSLHCIHSTQMSRFQLKISHNTGKTLGPGKTEGRRRRGRCLCPGCLCTFKFYHKAQLAHIRFQ